MGIVIHKDQIGVKFYLNDDDPEPAAVIYSGSNAGIISDDMVLSCQQAEGISQAMLIMGIFITSLDTEETNMKDKIFTVMFYNIVTGPDREQRYSARQILSNIFSGSIVTVDKKKRLKYEFIDFGFNDSKLIVNYKPVIW